MCVVAAFVTRVVDAFAQAGVIRDADLKESV
jgi:hypothetical protein